MNYMYKNTEVF